MLLLCGVEDERMMRKTQQKRGVFFIV